MITTRRLLTISIWLGFALAALSLYPLAVALDSDIFYMQWQVRDTMEVIAATALLGVVFGALVFALWRRPGRGATFALGLVAAIPVASLLAGLARQLPFDDALIAAWENQTLRFGLPAGIVLVVLFAFVKYPDTFGRWLRRGLLAISFVSLVVVEIVVTAASYAAPPTDVQRASQATQAGSCPPVLALLFDELSFAYLYDGNEVRADYPALKRLSSMATNYLAAKGPADETLVALPGYLASRHVESVRVNGMDLLEVVGEDKHTVPFDPGAMGLFGTARALGYRTEMAGYYLPYCHLLDGIVDRCRSFSFYNASTVGNGFSLLNPIKTTFIMWPRQFPFGLLKNIPFAWLQRGLVEQLTAFASQPVDRDGPVFRLVHFSVPHLPFVFDENGYNPPFNPLHTSPDDAYVRQIRYVDRLVGQLMDEMERGGTFDRMTFIVFADHGFRFGGRERDKLHVPFIVKRPGQKSRSDVTEPQPGELLLRQTLQSSCES
jgi:hypothetical protein